MQNQLASQRWFEVGGGNKNFIRYVYPLAWNEAQHFPQY